MDGSDHAIHWCYSMDNDLYDYLFTDNWSAISFKNDMRERELMTIMCSIVVIGICDLMYKKDNLRFYHIGWMELFYYDSGCRHQTRMMRNEKQLL